MIGFGVQAGPVIHRPSLALGLSLAIALPAGARAADAVCWFENGAVVVPAEIGGVAGDWLLDPSSPRTELHETRAQMAGFPATFSASGHLAGATLAPVAVTVANLDGRATGFSTPIAGVIGADVLGRYVVDLAFAPCRVRLSRGEGHKRPGSRAVTLTTVAGVPAVLAAVSDDRRARRGAFAIDLSARAAVRLTAARLAPPGSTAERAPRSIAPARLRAMSLDGALYEEPSAALAPDLDPALAGALGTDFWSRWRLRLDIGHGRLWLIAQ